MEKLECPHCGGPLKDGMAVCGECGKEVTDQGNGAPGEERRSGKKIYAVLAVILVVIGGAALMIYTGLLPNPLKEDSAAAIVNGEKISRAERQDGFIRP